ncbi:KTSC domain-containing protein [Noviherbaspirillum pedocola]|uniref:KTSC domain-containing protein n=1 Tax=Noviherbaspirillum pedocola TaxID=2801341 RepID=A0A934W1Q1_9BURK|nr:KTSC domain-containing protein [Noviherbaspirillum pedocola]MBK4735446.1 KTSC domain-containing protein [Noviherbaspirillum pedocola]
MEMKTIRSGKLRAAGYDPRQRLLRVEFEDGSAIEYSGVGADVWARLSSSGAAWSYYRDNIEDEFTGRRGSSPAARSAGKSQALADLFKPPGDDDQA